MPFHRISATPPPPTSPENLFRNLSTTSTGISSLWLHQGDILRAYEQHKDAADVAIELPTGTGKTLVGLLIAEWSRQYHGERAAYACLTQQLANQVVDFAERQGIPVVNLIGSHTGWTSAAATRYEGAKAVAIVTYSTIFNSNPHLFEPGILVFDDAHAAEQYVADAYSVTINRSRHRDLYAKLIDVLTPSLRETDIARFSDDTLDPAARTQTTLVVPLSNDSLVDGLAEVLGSFPPGNDEAFRYSMLRNGLRVCLVYLAWDSILIRPFIPPTFENHVFTRARQRVYLSATLGEGGELERTFGRSPIQRLRLPEQTEPPRSGRRFFIFPELTAPDDPVGFTKQIVEQAGKALVLSLDTSTAEKVAESLTPNDSWRIFGRDEVRESLRPFTDAKHAICALASRYDGLDLPDQACRLIILAGLPSGQNLQERFLETKVRAGMVFSGRVRARVVQGAGRCTRGQHDWAIVIILGDDITRYLSRPETLVAMDRDIQAQIKFGLEHSDLDQEDVLRNASAFLNQDDEWRTSGEPALAELERDVVRRLPDGTDNLAKSAPYEVEACKEAWLQEFEKASEFSQKAAQELGGGEATRGYRAWWLYLAGLWLNEAGIRRGDSAQQKAAQDLIRQATETARPMIWIRELPELITRRLVEMNPEDLVAVQQIARRLETGVNTSKLQHAIEDMLAGLIATDRAKYEPALTKLGGFLGAEAYKPKENDQCDSAWCWDERLWITVEAKSEQSSDKLISLRDIRQTNTHLRQLAHSRGVPSPPIGSASIIVSPRQTIAPDAVAAAEPHVYIVSPQIVLGLGQDTKAAWQEIMTKSHGLQGEDLKELVTTVFDARFLLPSQVRERLTVTPVVPG